ncbi:MAG TPA: hypothetical protein VG225_07720 [Terracidiphilus sp.]|nr:hypothetical protein [Terracidiphilus sp.]
MNHILPVTGRCARPFLRAARSRCLVLFAAATLLTWPLRAQDPVKEFPQNYKLILENDQVTVIRAHYGPHEHVAVHEHSSYPTVYVYLSDSGPVRFDQLQVPAFSNVRPPVHAGDFQFAPGILGRHTVDNLGDQSSDFLRVELRQFPMKTGSQFRGNAPAALSQDSDAKQYSGPAVDVERVICLPDKLCALAAGQTPSLLVAFSGTRVVDNADPSRNVVLGPGEMKWLSTPDSLTVSAATTAPAHLLRIWIKTPVQHLPGL